MIGAEFIPFRRHRSLVSLPMVPTQMSDMNPSPPPPDGYVSRPLPRRGAVFVIAFIYPLSRLVKGLVEEREQRPGPRRHPMVARPPFHPGREGGTPCQPKHQRRPAVSLCGRG